MIETDSFVQVQRSGFCTPYLMKAHVGWLVRYRAYRTGQPGGDGPLQLLCLHNHSSYLPSCGRLLCHLCKHALQSQNGEKVVKKSELVKKRYSVVDKVGWVVVTVRVMKRRYISILMSV